MFEDSKLKVFKAVVLKKSFSKAAKDLGITQPAVSQNIAELERNLGFQLFDRLKGKVELTRKGQVFDSYADNILYWYELTEEVLCSREPLPENISIAASAGVPATELTSLITLIRKVSPLTKVIICPSGANDADLKLSSSVTPADGGLNGTPANGDLNGTPANGDLNGTPANGDLNGTPADGGLNGTPADGGLNGKPADGGLNAGHTESFVRQTYLTASESFAGSALCRLIMEKARCFSCGYAI